jgi:uncharacterized iron-regulated membrane protein
VGIGSALFLLVLAVTGFLLANKGRWDWMRPPEVQAQKVDDPAQVVSVATAVEAAFALQLPELKAMKDVDRVDYRPKSNVFKVISKEGYREVQVDGATGKVLSSSFRYDQLSEDIHDLSIAGDGAHEWLLPLVALALGGLAISGISLFTTPIWRRWRFRSGKVKGPSPPKGSMPQ